MFTYLFVLIGRYSNKLHLLEDKRSERAEWKSGEIAAPDQMEPGLVLVHAVQDRMPVRIGDIVGKL